MISRFKLFLQNRLRIFLGLETRSLYQITIDNGLKIGKNCHIMREVIIDPSHSWHIEIGDDVSIGPRCHIFAHDASTKRDLGYTVIGNVKIGDKCFIGAGTIVLPGVTIGSHCIIGAGAVVTKSMPNGCVAVGNPARVICTTEEYLNKRQIQMTYRPLYSETYAARGLERQNRA